MTGHTDFRDKNRRTGNTPYDGKNDFPKRLLYDPVPDKVSTNHWPGYTDALKLKDIGYLSVL